MPALELDEGRVLTEASAICSYLEGRYPEPNLLGVDFEERAFIEMANRRIEFYLLAGFANCIRHTHPGMASLEQPQFPEFGRSQGEKVRVFARWLDGELARQSYVAGSRFTVADISAFVALEFARGLMKFAPVEQRFLHLVGRASAKVVTLLRGGLPGELPPDTAILFVGFSYADIPLGKTFSVAFPTDKPSEAVQCASRIIAVTQQFGKPINEIPHGWKTICAVEFPAGIPQLVRELATVESWYENSNGLCISDPATVIAITETHNAS